MTQLMICRRRRHFVVSFSISLARTTDLTVRRHRILSEKLSNVIGSDKNSLKLLDSLRQDSNVNLSNVGKCANNRESDRNPDAPMLSDV